MTEGKFTKVTRSDTRLYGPQRLLLCGFSGTAQSKFESVLTMAGLSGIPLIWATDDQAETTLAELLTLPHQTGKGSISTLPRAIIVSGIAEKALHGLMALCRKTGMKNAIWAALTPTSETWTLKMLLAELAAENAAFRRK